MRNRRAGERNTMNIRDRARSAGLFARLRRDPRRGWVAGVCVGIADFFGWNVKLIRLLVIASLIISGFFPVGVIYLGLWYLMEDVTKSPLDDERERTPRRPSPYSPPPSSDPVDVNLRFARLERRLRSMEACVTSSDFELRREFRKLES